MKVVFLGTPQIAVPSLNHLLQKKDIDIVAVVTQPDRPAGRGKQLQKSPIKLIAEENNINIYQPKSIKKDEDLIEILKELKPDFFITFAFGQILSQEVLDIPKFGTVNLHASLLPEYRGANPIQRVIVEGKELTGVTTMLTDIGVDTGDILLKEDIEITPDMNSLELAEIISKISPEILYKTIKGYADGSIKRIEQEHDLATHAAKFQKEDGVIDWNDTALNIHNKVRGMYPWPSAYTNINGMPIKIIQTSVCELKSNKKPGEIAEVNKKGIIVSTFDGDILIKKLQPQGKKEMDAYAWANGARIVPGGCFQ